MTKDELLDSVWPGQPAIEHNLVVQVSALCGLLGRESIATFPGRPRSWNGGFCFFN